MQMTNGRKSSNFVKSCEVILHFIKGYLVPLPPSHYEQSQLLDRNNSCLSDNYQAAVKQLSGSRQAVVKQSTDSHQLLGKYQIIMNHQNLSFIAQNLQGFFSLFLIVKSHGRMILIKNLECKKFWLICKCLIFFQVQTIF